MREELKAIATVLAGMLAGVGIVSILILDKKLENLQAMRAQDQEKVRVMEARGFATTQLVLGHSDVTATGWPHPSEGALRYFVTETVTEELFSDVANEKPLRRVSRVFATAAQKMDGGSAGQKMYVCSGLIYAWNTRYPAAWIDSGVCEQ